MIMSAGHWNEAPLRLASEIKSRVKENIGVLGGAHAGLNWTVQQEEKDLLFSQRKIDTY